MSEEEMINKIKEFIDGYRLYDTRTGETIIPYKYGEGQRYVFKESYYAIQQLLNSYTNLKQIEQEHQKINGELREEIKQLKEELLKENNLNKPEKPQYKHMSDKPYLKV